MNWKRRVVDCEPERPIRVYVPAGETIEPGRSWTTRVRGAPSTYEAAEYECPKHGRFEIVMQRPSLDIFECPYPQTSVACDAACCRVFPSPGIGKSSGDVSS